MLIIFFSQRSFSTNTHRVLLLFWGLPPQRLRRSSCLWIAIYSWLKIFLCHFRLTLGSCRSLSTVAVSKPFDTKEVGSQHQTARARSRRFRRLSGGWIGIAGFFVFTSCWFPWIPPRPFSLIPRKPTETNKNAYKPFSTVLVIALNSTIVS